MVEDLEGCGNWSKLVPIDRVLSTRAKSFSGSTKAETDGGGSRSGTAMRSRHHFWPVKESVSSANGDILAFC